MEDCAGFTESAASHGKRRQQNGGSGGVTATSSLEGLLNQDN